MSLRDAADATRRAQSARKAAGKSNFNADRTRYISREFLGWALYAGVVEGADFKGRRVGVVEEEATADRWLAGERVYCAQKADEHGNLRVGGGWSDADPEWDKALAQENEERLERVNPPEFTPYDFCDGNHAAPRCLDPRCWRDDDEDVATGLQPVEEATDGRGTENGIREADRGGNGGTETEGADVEDGSEGAGWIGDPGDSGD